MEAVDEADDAQSDDAQIATAQAHRGSALRPESVTASGHETRPPARYTEPSLVAKLEELEIGRPSTYASILRTITSRDYVFKKGSALVPTWLAFAVTRLLEEHFPKLVDYAFTAEMEEILDQIADGHAERLQVLTDFYFGAEVDVDPGGPATAGVRARRDRRPQAVHLPASVILSSTASSCGSAATAPTSRTRRVAGPTCRMIFRRTSSLLILRASCCPGRSVRSASSVSIRRRD